MCQIHFTYSYYSRGDHFVLVFMLQVAVFCIFRISCIPLSSTQSSMSLTSYLRSLKGLSFVQTLILDCKNIHRFSLSHNQVLLCTVARSGPRLFIEGTNLIFLARSNCVALFSTHSTLTISLFIFFPTL